LQIPKVYILVTTIGNIDGNENTIGIKNNAQDGIYTIENRKKREEMVRTHKGEGATSAGERQGQGEDDGRVQQTSPDCRRYRHTTTACES
jgi:hypothetical protein